jgi:PPOX class probable F420-dependent enzyme
MAKLTEDQRAFIRENPFYAVVTTLRKDGSPHATVVWVDEEDGKILLNTAYPRAKSKDLTNDPRAAVTIIDPTNPYRWISVSGPVTLTTDGANDDIDRLSRKYTGNDYQSHREGETRVSIWLEPEKVTAYQV